YDQSQFEEVCKRTRELVEEQGIKLEAIVPISALRGENVSVPTAKLEWYVGKTLLGTLQDTCNRIAQTQGEDQKPFRMLLQDVYKFSNERYFAGRVISGAVKTGTEIFFSPSGKISKIEAIEKFPQGEVASASAGESVALRLSEQIFVERGEVITILDEAPEVDNELRGKVVWLSRTPWSVDNDYIVKIGTSEVSARVQLSTAPGVERSFDADPIANGSFIDVIVKLSRPVAFDKAATGSVIDKFVIASKFETVAAGVVDSRPIHTVHAVEINPDVKHESGYVERSRYEESNQHKGAVLWLTGLSGAGKSTLAKRLEQVLFERGFKTVVLDGDNLRTGLCADLGFSPEERSENIRRIAHTARLFLDTGFIAIAACISPYTRDREVARQIIGDQDFNEIFVFCPFEECQRRDPKGLYVKASQGKIASLTGVNSPYQPPHKPSLRLDSSKMNLDDEVEAVIRLLKARQVIPADDVTRGSPVGQNAGALRGSERSVISNNS
ncbi:MAG TPA: adenylyl-sulfate kinase, partial [Chroococcales cyanobacterium]